MKRATVALVICFVVFGAVCGLAQPVSSGGASLAKLSLEELMQIPVSVASRTPGTIFTSPGTVYVITRDDINRHGWRDLSEILNAMIPNLYGQYDGAKHIFGGRGYDFDGSRLLLMLDGRVMTGYIFANASFMCQAYSAANIERVEVLMGPNSMLYGASALEAIVNVITRAGGSAARDTTAVEVIRGMGGLQQNSVVVRRVTEDAELGFHYTEYLSDSDFPQWAKYYRGTEFMPGRPVVTTEQWQQHKEDRMLNLYGRYKGVYAGYNYWRLDSTPDGFEAARLYTTTPFGRRDIWEFFVPYAGYTQVFSDRLKANVETEYRYFTRDKIRGVDTAGKGEGRVDHERQLNPVYKVQVDWMPDDSDPPRHHLMLGGEYRRSTREIENRVLGIDGGEFWYNPDLTVKDSAKSIFVQDEMTIVPGKLNLTAGLSYTKYESVTNATWCPRASLVWLTGPESSAKLTYGEGVREDILAKRVEDPEKLRMIEANYSKAVRFGEVRCVNSVSIFWMDYENMNRSAFIPSGPFSRYEWKNISVSSLGVYGIEDMIRLSWGDADVYVSANLNEREEEPTRVGDMAAYVPAYMVKAGCSYRVMKHVSAATEAIHLGTTRSYMESAPYNGTAFERSDLPAWTKVDVNLRADGFKLGGMEAAVNLRVGNVFDSDGLTHFALEQARGLMIEPRSLRIDFSLEF